MLHKTILTAAAVVLFVSDQLLAFAAPLLPGALGLLALLLLYRAVKSARRAQQPIIHPAIREEWERAHGDRGLSWGWLAFWFVLGNVAGQLLIARSEVTLGPWGPWVVLASTILLLSTCHGSRPR